LGQCRVSTIEEIRAYYDRVADSYDGRAAANPHITILNNVTWKWITGHLPKDKRSRVLDAGGGTGKWAIPIAKLGYEVTLLDISAKMLMVARKKIEEQGLGHLIDVRQGDMERTDFLKEYFDFILCEGDAFSLTPNPARALREFNRILKFDGLVSLNICNHYKLFPIMIQRMAKIDDIRRYFAESGYGQEPFEGATFRTWRPEEALKMITDAGFDIQAYAPRQVLADLLSDEIEKAMKVDEEILEGIQQLEEEFIRHPILAALGGHIMIVAIKAATRTLR